MEITHGLTVRQVMTPSPLMVPSQTPLCRVVGLMNERRTGSVLIGVNGVLQGIFTERDMLRRACGAAPGWGERPVSEWMTRDPWTITPDASWEQAVSTMETLHVRHLPVVEEERVVGVLSARALMENNTVYLNQLVAERTKELREAYERLQQRDRELQAHMAVAARLQQRLLPGKPPTLPDMDWAGHYQPLDPLGGDYYDFAQPDDRHVGVLIADASGHSIPAAMVAIMARTAFTTVAPTTDRTDEVLAGMNEQLHGLTGEHFVTAFYGVLDRKSRLLTFANAGHPYPIVYRHLSQSCEPLAAHGVMLGILPDTRYDVHHVQLNPHDKLLFYTDGVVDCRSETDEPLGVQRLEAFLKEHGRQPVRELLQALAAHLTEYRGARNANDDMTLLAAEVK
jgi:serine phosphatase RsbU (regulator of sigma subunit)/CBS domain-containing protein